MPNTITLKYPATCADCGTPLPVGASARYYGAKRVYGIGCHERSIPVGIPATATRQTVTSSPERRENGHVPLEPCPEPAALDYPEPRVSGEGVEITCPDWPPTSQIKRELIAAHIDVARLDAAITEHAGRKGVTALRTERETARANVGRWTAWEELDSLRLSAMPVLDQITEIGRRTEEATADSLAADAQREHNRAIRETWGEGRALATMRRINNGYENEPSRSFQRAAPGSQTLKREHLEEREAFHDGRASVYRAVDGNIQIIESSAGSAGSEYVTQSGMWGGNKAMYQTEAEFNGVRESQGALDMGKGELATETAGPLFLQSVAAA